MNTNIEKHKMKLTKKEKSMHLKYCDIVLDLEKSRTRLSPSKIRFGYYAVQDLSRYNTFLVLLFCDYEAIKKITLDKKVALIKGLQEMFKHLKGETISNRIRLLNDIHNMYLYDKDSIKMNEEIKYLENELNNK